MKKYTLATNRYGFMTKKYSSLAQTKICIIKVTLIKYLVCKQRVDIDSGMLQMYKLLVANPK